MNTTKLMIAAFALCGTCFLSCEKEESSKPEPEPEPTTPTAPIKFDSISVGSFEVEFYYTSKDRLSDAYIYISKDSLKLDSKEDIEFIQCKVFYESDKGNPFGYYFNTLAPNTKYYYRVRTCKTWDEDYYDSIRTFTTKDASLITCEKATSTARKICLYGTKANYTTITDNFTPTVNIYYSTRKTKLCADSIENVGKKSLKLYEPNVETIDYEPNVETKDIVALTNLNEFTQYYVCAAFSTDKKLVRMGDIIPVTTSHKEYDAKLIDLGLSVLWADRNVGATSEEEKGDKFELGEIKEGEHLYEYPYHYYRFTDDSLYKCAINDSIICFSGNKQHDAATANLGETWRTPTVKEMQELIDMCEWDYVKVYDIWGYLVTGLNGNTIFLPNCDGYWTSEVDYNKVNHTSNAYRLKLWVDRNKNRHHNIVSIDRLYYNNFEDGYGCEIRPVCSK